VARKIFQNKYRMALTLIMLLPLSACGLVPYEFHSLLESQPYVTAVEPNEGSELEAFPEIRLQFSERIDLAKVNPQTVALIAAVKDAKPLEDSDALIDGLREASFPTIPLQYYLDAGETALTVSSDIALSPGAYHLVVTPAVVSAQGIPFNQKPGEAPAPFIAEFHYGDAIGQAPGNPAMSPDPRPEFGPAPETMVINEFMYDGKSSETDGECFVELFGSANSDISLYQVQFINGADGAITDRITLPLGSRVRDDGLFLIADLRTGSASESQVSDPDFTDQFDPQNGPDGIILIDRNGYLLDSVAYSTGGVTTTKDGLGLGEGSPAKDVTAGHSLSRHNGMDTDDNHADFTDQVKPSPGKI